MFKVVVCEARKVHRNELPSIKGSDARQSCVIACMSTASTGKALSKTCAATHATWLPTTLADQLQPPLPAASTRA